MAIPNNRETTQLDIELTDMDRAARAVRELQSGKASITQVREALKKVPLGDLETVAFATRSTVRQLTQIRGQ